jgi:glycine/D-amino acid oxidase-like deaminating enzyme/nitrite reductase/ring-hydroxylating ferredoxin subunit
VIGGGFTGTSIAYRLACEGRAVVMLDDGELLGAETALTTAQLVTALDRGYAALERIHGAAGICQAAESHAAAIATIEDTVKAEGIACDFERLDGYLCGDPATIGEEFVAARRAGLPVERCSPPTVALARGACIRFPRQAQFHPLRYLTHLLDATRRKGGRVFSHTRASSIAGTGTAVQVATTAGPAVTAEAVVVATNTPINSVVSLHTKQAAYRTYVIALRTLRGPTRAALYWDTEQPFHYVRLVRTSDASGDLLLVGGEDHKTGQRLEAASGAYERLEAWARANFSDLGGLECRWSGQIMESIDGLAFIGRTEKSPNVFVVTGDSGNGLTHGAIASLLVTDQIQGRANPWSRLYDPARLPLRALGEFTRENVNVIAQLGDWVRPSPVHDPRVIPPGSGAVVQRGLRRVAVYKDGLGALHEHSAVCPHLRCVVRWNSVESTWDCPCHGSRFDAYGVVLNGPANQNLEPAS